MKLFKSKSNRPEICLSLNCKNLDEVKQEIEKYGNFCQIVEWCVDKVDGAEDLTKENYIAQISHVKNLAGKKKLIIDYKGDEVVMGRILRWSMGICDIIDVDADNPEIHRLVKEAHKNNTKVLVSHHEFDRMPRKHEIGEMYLKLEKTRADILKIACFAESEMDTYEILEGAMAYSQLKNSKPIVAIAMGTEGQVSRICAGDFGSVISYSCGTEPTAPGQFDAEKLSKYMDKYYQKGN